MDINAFKTLICKKLAEFKYKNIYNLTGVTIESA